MKDNEKEARFKTWLLEHGYTRKVTSDLVSRCTRIERDMNVELSCATSDEASFRLLMISIQCYAVSRFKDTLSARSATGALRSAARKFALFEHGEKVLSYKYSHALTKYPSSGKSGLDSE